MSQNPQPPLSGGDAAATPAAGYATGRTPLAFWRTLALWLAPLALLVGTRDWAKGVIENLPAAWPLTPVTVIESWWSLLWPWALGLVAALMLAVAFKRWARRAGALSVGRLLLALWWLACLVGAGHAWRDQANRGGLPAASEVTAQVLGVADKPASARGVGGAMLYLQSPAWPQPQRVLVEDEKARQIKPGAALRLNVAPGRFSGLYVTAITGAGTP